MDDTLTRLDPKWKRQLQTIRRHAKTGRIDQAEKVLDQLLKRIPHDEKETRDRTEDFIWECIRCIIRGCSRLLDSQPQRTNNHHNIKLPTLVSTANRFIEIGKTRFPESTNDNIFRRRCMGAWIELYVCAGKFSALEHFLESPNADPWILNRVIIELGKKKQPEIATSFLKQAIQNQSTTHMVQIEMFYSLLNAWIESSKPNAFPNAWQILSMLNDDPAIKFRLRPDTSLYGALLQCLYLSKMKDAGRKAIEILDEMDRSHQLGNPSCKPNHICYTIAIKTCLQCEPESVDGLLVRMERSGLPPDVRTYNDIMSHWSKTRTQQAAERVERILAKMKTHTVTGPDVVSYNIVLATWARTSSENGNSIGLAKMWSTYEQMMSENIQPDRITMNTLVGYLTKSYVRRLIQKADNLLLTMENTEGPDLKPDDMHFSDVIQGWLSVGEVDLAKGVLERCAKAYSKAKNKSALKRMDDLERILRAYVKKGYIGKATALFEEFSGNFKKRILPFGPNLDTHVLLLNEWKKHSNHPDQKKNIERIEASIAALKRK